MSFEIAAEYVLKATSTSAQSVEVQIETTAGESYAALCVRVIAKAIEKIGETDEVFAPATWAIRTDGNPMTRDATTVTEAELAGAHELSAGEKIYFFPASVKIYNNTFFKTKHCPN